MAGFRRIEIIDELSPAFFVPEAPLLDPKTLPLSYELDLPRLSLPFALASPFEIFDAHLIQIEQPPPLYDPFARLVESHRLRALSDRVSLLELGYDRLASGKSAASAARALCDRVSALELGHDRLVGAGDRKYEWTAEIKCPEEDGFDRKYKWSAEIKGAARSQEKKKQKKKAAPAVKNYKWTAETKGGKVQRTEAVKVKDPCGRVRNYKWSSEMNGKSEEEIPIQRTYTFKASAGGEDRSESDREEKKVKKAEKKKEEGHTRAVEIEGSPDQRALVLRQAFARRTRADLKRMGKRKELSPQDAAMVIQVTFRAYLIRRSQTLRALRELAKAKAKLKEIRELFHNLSCHASLARDAAERQRFTEKIIVLLLTVDSIEGADMMVRSSKRSILDELEAMLDVVDPLPQGTSLSLRRRMFDMPNGAVQKEMAASVAKVVQLVEQDENGSAPFEACL